MRIPASLDDVDAAWMTAAMRDGGVIEQGEVTSLRPTRIATDVGFLGALARVELTWSGADDAPPTAIVKLPTDDPTNNLTGQLLDSYRREQGFYQEAAHEEPARIPICYFHAHDPQTNAMVLVLEDLGGWRQPDQTVGVDPDDAAVAMQALGAHHAHWWQSERAEAFDWLARWDGPYSRGLGPLARDGLAGYLDRFGDVMGPHGEELFTRVVDGWEAINDEGAGRRPRTLIHGDFRVDNCFYGDGELALCDWANTIWTSPDYDVAYFIGTGMQPDLRRGAERDLLAEWRRSLAAGGVDLDGDEVDEIWRSGIATLAGAIVIIASAVDLGDRRGQAIFMTATRNVGEMAETHGVFDLLDSIR